MTERGYPCRKRKQTEFSWSINDAVSLRAGLQRAFYRVACYAVLTGFKRAQYMSAFKKDDEQGRTLVEWQE